MSTENTAFRLTHNVVKSTNQKMHLEGTSCGLPKAFVCINHYILLRKLHFFEIPGVFAVWIKLHLTES